MKILPNIDPTTIASAGPTGLTVDTGLTSGCGTVYYMNKSNVGIKIIYDNGFNIILPAWYARAVVFQAQSMRQTFEQAYVLNQFFPPISQLYMEAFQKGEDTSGLYSGPIPYQSTNAIQGSVTTANQLVNQGNTTGTVFITADVGAGLDNRITLTNDGVLTLGSSSNFTGKLIINTASGLFEIDNNGNILQVSGQHIQAQLIDVTALGTVDLGFHVNTGQHIVDTIVGTGDVAKTGAEGLSVLIGSLISKTDIQVTGLQTTINGDLSGTATLTEIFTGANFKLYLLNKSNFHMSTTQTFSLGAKKFNTFCQFFTGGIGSSSLQFWNGGIQQTVSVVTSLASSGGGVAFPTTFGEYCLGMCNTGVDQFTMPSLGGPNTGCALFWGF